ncbi:MAG: cobalt ECF transporter T component CbiQ [Cyanobacteriota bacterium]|nr:cobalt ECF transporter T component CbiQ [Cyanobacteriota bacterium]
MSSVMRLNLPLDSPLHRWDPRGKLLGLLSVILAFALVEDLRLLPAMVVVTAFFYGLSRLPWWFWWQRCRYPGVFLLGVVLFLPFLSGETVIAQWGGITLRQEGCEAVVLIGVRFFCLLTLSLVLLNTSPLLTTVKAMRALGLSSILADMLLLTYRYLSQLADDLEQMRQAMRLRGFDPHPRRLLPDRHYLAKLASLAGSLFVRSYEQSERVYQAMRLRGYGMRIKDPVAVPWDRGSLWATGLTCLLSIGFISMEFLVLGS